MACSGVTACCAVALGAAVGLPVGEHETRAAWIWGRLGAFVCRGRGRGTVLVHAGLGWGRVHAGRVRVRKDGFIGSLLAGDLALG